MSIKRTLALLSSLLGCLFRTSVDLSAGPKSKHRTPIRAEAGAGRLKGFGHALIRLRGVIRRVRAPSCEIQFFCSCTKDDFITRVCKLIEKRAVKGPEIECKYQMCLCYRHRILKTNPKPISSSWDKFSFSNYQQNGEKTFVMEHKACLWNRTHPE